MAEKDSVITPEQENMVRVCTREYMDKKEQWPNGWVARIRNIINDYKQVARLIDSKKGLKKHIVAKAVETLIIDEWREYE